MQFKLLIITLLLICLSCTKKVDLGVVYEKKIVVEGGIENGQRAQLRLSQTVSATDNDVFPMVENALVELTDMEGNSEILIESSAGIYEGNSLLGEPDKSYTLTIQSENKNYSATTKIPKLTVDLATIRLDTVEVDSFGLTIQTVVLQFEKTRADSIYCQFDLFSNDQKIGQPIFYKSEIPVQQNLELDLFTYNLLQSGQVIQVKMLQMESWQFNYQKSIQEKGEEEIISGLLIGPPDNLVGNIENGGLGYFGAINQAVLEFEVP